MTLLGIPLPRQRRIRHAARQNHDEGEAAVGAFQRPIGSDGMPIAIPVDPRQSADVGQTKLLPRTRPSRVPLLVGFVGAVAFGCILWTVGPLSVFAQIGAAGWLLPPLALMHVVPVLLDARAWQILTPPERPSLVAFGVARWIREGVNALLPAAQVGGELVAARILTRFGSSVARAAAVVTIDLITEFLSMVIVGIVGALLLHGATSDGSRHAAGSVALAMLPPLGIALGLFIALHARLCEQLARWSERWAPRLAQQLTATQTALDQALSRRRQLALATTLHCLGWSAGAVETWAAFRALGHPLDFSAAFALETTSEVLRSFGFFVPGLLGVQEGSLILVGGLLGLPPASMVALSLFRRVRDIALGLPAILFWQFAEMRAGRQAHPQREVSVPTGRSAEYEVKS